MLARLASYSITSFPHSSVMFRGQIERPFNPVHLLSYSDKQVTVAINTHCLHVIEARNKPVRMSLLQLRMPIFGEISMSSNDVLALGPHASRPVL